MEDKVVFSFIQDNNIEPSKNIITFYDGKKIIGKGKIE